MRITDIPAGILEKFRKGCVIPAHPLSLNEDKTMDTDDMRAIARYYIDAGVGGIAIGVHTTQFEIRDPDVGLFEKVLRFTSSTIDSYCAETKQSIMKISGVCGDTEQAISEARFSRELGFHASLLSLAALKDASIDEMIAHCKAIAAEIPIIGFYLQPAVGGRVLPFEFWRRFAEIDNVLGIKMAPFNRYQTIDVVRAVCEAGKENDITLYTGNDDNIVMDLLSPYRFETETGPKEIRIKGGLLGHWCVWTRTAVALIDELHTYTESNRDIPQELLTRNIEVTDSNAVFFDAANAFAGCIPGVHEVLRRQGLMKSVRCLNSKEILSPGQSDEIDRVYASYPHLNDDAFIKDNIDKWFA
ncbi:MAG: dihydrodipicolinate synthase family protein [Lentisphaeria bacterium]|nr:dihydrodipicolinate synthase family protein [Lentisphaeria bacterium]NQZ67180.1 dihydrodipicolinate synthase family protein [Lentisphaeria bacterium]